MTAPAANPLPTLITALLFAAIFLFGGRGDYRPDQKGRRRFLSFAAGISVGYVFVHILPLLSVIREFQTESPTDFQMLFPECGVYLWTLAGFLAFYGLETLASRLHAGADIRAGNETGTSPWQHWIHLGGFALYALLLTYCMVWTGKGALALCVFAVAIGMHIFLIASNLRSHCPAVYDRRGRWLLALACVAGWVCGQTLSIPRPLLFNLVAIVAGGVIVIAAIAELPKEKEGRFWSFVTGTALSTVLLLILSHFEKGGEVCPVECHPRPDLCSLALEIQILPHSRHQHHEWEGT